MIINMVVALEVDTDMVVALAVGEPSWLMIVPIVGASPGWREGMTRPAVVMMSGQAPVVIPPPLIPTALRVVREARQSPSAGHAVGVGGRVGRRLFYKDVKVLRWTGRSFSKPACAGTDAGTYETR